VVENSPHFPEILTLAEKHGMTGEEASTNLVFTLGFNAWGGLVGMGRSLVGELTLRDDLRPELDAASVENFVLEVVRLHPPVNFFYAEAKEAMTVESAGKAYRVRGGDLLMGVSWFAHRDPEIYPDPEAFRPDRFEDQACVRYLMWSNGPGDGTPAATNKMCPGHDTALWMTRRLALGLRDHVWTLAEPPSWSRASYPRAGGPGSALQVQSFSRR
jgi:cytochrome P450